MYQKQSGVRVLHLMFTAVVAFVISIYSVYSQEIDHWETIIQTGNACRYYVPNSDIGRSWIESGFQSTFFGWHQSIADANVLFNTHEIKRHDVILARNCPCQADFNGLVTENLFCLRILVNITFTEYTVDRSVFIPVASTVELIAGTENQPLGSAR